MKKDAAQYVAVQVRATAPGFHVGRRRVGDEFEYSARVKDGKPVLASWMVLASEPKAEPAPPEDPGPQTLSAGAKALGIDLV